MKHFALFDALYLGHGLEEKIDDFSLSELQILSYLSCLLSIYDSNNSSDWGYFFTKNESGYPFSIDLEQSLAYLKNKQLINSIKSNSNYNIIEEDGVKFLDKLSENLSIYSQRKKYLDASLNCISLAPFGVIRNALLKEPVLNSAKRKKSVMLLNDEDFATTMLYDQFKELKIVLKNDFNSLLVPAFTWLSGNLQQQIG